jgi:uncharacterized protein (TIGR02757 family)
VKADPVEFPHRYHDARDIETVALLSASLAYGRAQLFKPKIESILVKLGPRPASTVSMLTVSQVKDLLSDFVYRFNVASDVAVLLLGVGALLQQQGSLEAAFVATRQRDWQKSLAAFARSVRAAAPEREIIQAMGPIRGLSHLLPVAESGAAKRLNLFLRWMARPRDDIDFGVWHRVSPAELMIPLDTHVMRISQWLGLTSRNALGWKTVEDVTASLRLLDAEDPIRYDFALCHYGMSGACPAIPVTEGCASCALRSSCRIGKKVR